MATRKRRRPAEGACERAHGHVPTGGLSDGVIAIIITIMVLEFEVPDGAGWADLAPLRHVALGYVLSFVDLGMHRASHHHLMHAAPGVDGATLWANLHSLFWLSLIPIATAWMGRSAFAPVPTAVYGAAPLAAALAHRILERQVESLTKAGSPLRRAMGRDRKGWASVAAYVAGIALAFVSTWAAAAV